MLLALEIPRPACGAGRVRAVPWRCRLLPFVAGWGEQPGLGLNVSVDCSELDVSCGGLRRRISTSFFSCVVRREGTAVNLSPLGGGGLEAQLRVHASQRSSG